MNERAGEPRQAVPLRLDEPSEFGAQCLELFVKPGLKRRRAAGEALPTDGEIHAVQVVFDPAGGFSLRLNDEIEGQLDVTLHDDTELDGGNAISLVAIERINQFTPAEEDANAAHITLLRLRSGWVGLVNLVYNAEIADSFETAAAEFLDAAEASLAQGLFRPFADSLHSSVELLAQDSSTSTPNTQASLAADLPVGTDARRPPTDGSAPTRDARFVALHNRVADLRAPARYAIGSFDLPTDDATTLLGEARAMQQELRDLIARPGD